MSAGDAPSYNLGIIKVKQGDYAAAVNYFGNKPSFNAALAQMLNGNNEKEINRIDAIIDRSLSRILSSAACTLSVYCFFSRNFGTQHFLATNRLRMARSIHRLLL
jgi:hypothetical protein